MGGQTIGASDSKVVQIAIDGRHETTVPTRADTVGELLERLNIQVHEQDIVEPGLDKVLEDDFSINIYRARPVTIIDGENKTVTLSAQQNPVELVKKSGYEVSPEDKVETVADEDVLRQGVIGEKVIIDRALTVTINLYGTSFAVKTQADTVGELLSERGIKTLEGDSLQPSSDTKITPNSQVFVIRAGHQIETVEEEIPMPEEEVRDNTLSVGTRKVTTVGAPGKRLRTYEINSSDPSQRRVIQEIVAIAPVKQIVSVGTKDTKLVYIGDKSSTMAAAGIAESDYAYADAIISRESGWCATKWQGRFGYCPPTYEEIHSPSSGYGYGLCQSTPAIKMSSAGGDYLTNPVTQLRWCSGYAQGRYGSWQNAYNFWVVNRWW
jgi:resuscitation-promoting factor RpfB